MLPTAKNTGPKTQAHRKKRQRAYAPHAQHSTPIGARQRRSEEVEVAKVAPISMLAPLHMPWKYFGNTCAQGGRGQGARYALLVSHPLCA